jgi:hypothetical protein
MTTKCCFPHLTSMAQLVIDIRAMMRIAGDLRQSAHTSALPDYKERLLRAAGEVEGIARIRAAHINSPDFDLEFGE